MAISVLLSSMATAMMQSNEEVLSVFAKKDAQTASGLNGLGTLLSFVYMVIAIFKGAKWYLSPLLFVGAIILGTLLTMLFAKIFGMFHYARDNFGEIKEIGVTYNKYIILVVSLLQLVSVVFAYIAWF